MYRERTESIMKNTDPVLVYLYHAQLGIPSRRCDLRPVRVRALLLSVLSAVARASEELETRSRRRSASNALYGEEHIGIAEQTGENRPYNQSDRHLKAPTVKQLWCYTGKSACCPLYGRTATIIDDASNRCSWWASGGAGGQLELLD